MKRIFLPAALIVALASTLAIAQQQPAPIERQPPSDSAPMQQPAGRHHRPHDPPKEAKHLSKALNLTADQSAKLEPVLAKRQQKMAALDADTNLTPKDRHKQKRAIHRDTEQQLSSILTPDQVQQMKAMHKGHGHKGAEPLNPPPAA